VFTSIKKHNNVIFCKNNKIDKMNSKILVCGTRTTGFVHGGGKGGPTSTGSGKGLHFYDIQYDTPPTKFEAKLIA
jgi:hypothetical protein